ncbi:hypothetical protein CONCODRAFT_83331 [Conidiobolus coronatus NRRL 28638]|uniref:Uncharacterized protein n=1 Tax=Conidiobolus coronatus (strain ATCC 28846 / CBS 209.66 / NRRL 28638) TaxID=796925 RepID=A0A137PFS5_CONC2|nr:hypothetical protein CONCODRAFT_83331 [Conidiobolus coronatus NRRL 28638]|eukprot:KXN73820.1 hypothetical protein CONCODRAFT_83331 [Conidiobolus coronatus NRRL 28638]
MQLTTLVIIFSSFFNIQKVLGAPVPQFDFDVSAVGGIIEELDFVEEEQIGLENAVQKTGSAGGTINNLNAGKNKNHSTIIELEEDEEVGEFVVVDGGELTEEIEEVEEVETITETDVMDIEVEVDEPEVNYPEGYRHRHGRHHRRPRH